MLYNLIQFLAASGWVTLHVSPLTPFFWVRQRIQLCLSVTKIIEHRADVAKIQVELLTVVARLLYVAKQLRKQANKEE